MIGITDITNIIVQEMINGNEISVLELLKNIQITEYLKKLRIIEHLKNGEISVEKIEEEFLNGINYDELSPYEKQDVEELKKVLKMIANRVEDKDKISLLAELSGDLSRFILIINLNSDTSKIEQLSQLSYNYEKELVLKSLSIEGQKKCINKRKELGLDGNNITELIISINDPNYTKECIDRRKELGLDGSDIFKLIESINDPNYTKECIDRRKELGLELDDVFDIDHINYIIELIISINDPNYTKDCIDRRKELGLDGNDIFKLIVSINDPNYTKDCIDRREELGLARNNITELIISINDPKYTKECIDRRKELGLELDDVLDIDHINYITELIISINDPEYTKDCIDRRKELGLNNYCLQILIISINDPEYTKDCIDRREKLGLHWSNIFKIIESINDPVYLKDCINRREELGLDGDDEFYGDYINKLIIKINDPEYTKKCIDERKKLRLDRTIIKDLIIRINDPKYTMKCIDSREALGLDFSDIPDLIIRINDSEYIKNCIDRRKELRLDRKTIKDLIIKINDPEYTMECICNREAMELDFSDIIDLIKSIHDPKKCLYERKHLRLPNEVVGFLIDIIDDIPQDVSLEILKDGTEGMTGEQVFKVMKFANHNLIKKINYEQLIEIFSMPNGKYIRKYIMDYIILKNVNKEKIDINKINIEISTLYNIFLTNCLPINFKIMQYFKHHEDNLNATNMHFYEDDDPEKRNKIISIDLLRILLESDNFEMRHFLEILYNGHRVLKRHETTRSEISRAILLEYRNTVYDLINQIEGYRIQVTQNYEEDLKRVKELLDLDEFADLGEVVLKLYLKNAISLVYKNEGQPLVEHLLEYMNKRKEQAKINNQQAFQIEEGDLIKGIDIIYLEDLLKYGIRANEFLMNGDFGLNNTPLDADFSEIIDKNLSFDKMRNIIESTYSSIEYGKTLIVVKKESYENNRIPSYSPMETEMRTRYLRTGIGSTHIRRIYTSEWIDEYKYMMAQLSFPIEVIDLQDEKVLFSSEDYKQIRQMMQGLSHFGCSDYIIDPSAYDNKIIEQATIMRKNAEGKQSTQYKIEKIVELVRANIDKEISTEMLGDITSKNIELINTGSTGRGTNIPGDGNFDFMLNCASEEERTELIERIKSFLTGKDKGGTDQLNIKYGDVIIEGINEPIEVDISSEKKSLALGYSSDLAIRDRLNSIKMKYGEEGLRIVVDNIIVAKKILKEKGMYKRSGSTGSTSFGGLGGIGLENWILQNGGSFTKAMQTFLEATVDNNGNNVSFDTFKRNYPIYDFGKNHRFQGMKNSHLIEGLTELGFEEMKRIFKELLKDREVTEIKVDVLGNSIVEYVNNTDLCFSDMSAIFRLIAKLQVYELGNNQIGIGRR